MVKMLSDLSQVYQQTIPALVNHPGHTAFFFWAVGLLKDICSMAEKYRGPKGCCGMWDLLCLTQITWLTSVTEDQIRFDLI